MMPRLFHALTALGLVFFASPLVAQDGLFARIATNKGTIRVSLDFDQAPLAVANFVALAEGTQNHIDFTTGKVESGPFYNQKTFHQVNSTYIQAGPLGSGSAGSAGHLLGIEPHPALTHNQPFVIAMLGTSEGPSSGQFIITVESAPSLNSTHPVFGRVVEGQATAQAISRTPAANGRPVEPIIIQSVTIERIGTAATAFDPAAEGLPALANAPIRLRRDGSRLVLTSDFVAKTSYSWLRSDDLQEWDPFAITVVGDAVDANLGKTIDTPSAFGREFFRVVEIAYPAGQVLAPSSVVNKELTLDISLYGSTPTQSTLIYEFYSSQSGRAYNGAARPVQFGAYSYTVEDHSQSLLIVPAEELIRPLNLLQITLSFMSLTHGVFEAFLPYAIPETAMRGTFTLLPRS